MTNSNAPETETPTKSIVLVGMMGVGKSSVGKRLAERMRLAFVDSDDEIEAAANMPIADIFEKYGEAHFRDGERRVIQRLINGPAKIIATGGGAFVDAETRQLIRRRAISVWLDADLNILVERLAHRSHRPLLRGKNRSEVREILINLAAERNPIYDEADHHVMGNNEPHARTIDKIIRALNDA